MSFTVTDATFEAVLSLDGVNSNSLLAIVLLVILLGMREYFGDKRRNREPQVLELLSVMIVPLLTTVGFIFFIQLISFRGILE